VNFHFLIFIGFSIIATAFALMATYKEYAKISESIANFGAMLGLLLSVFAFFRSK